MRAKEIDIVRSFVIIAVVLFHAMAPFTGGWKDLGITNSIAHDIYKWVGHIAYAGMLETFVALSGYVYAMSSIKHSYTVKSLAVSKFRRLMVPALIWGVAYWLLYGESNYIAGAWRVVNGIGHLWFLPMLFWCFLLEKAIVERFRISAPVLAVVAVLPLPGMPFYFSTAFYYLFFFHLGYEIYHNQSAFYKFAKPSNIAILCILAAPLVVINVTLRGNVELASLDFWSKRVFIFLFQLLRWSYSTMIVVAYMFFGYLCRKTRYYHVFNFIAAASFGVYLIQEFILKFLYYKVNILDGLGNYLPLGAFIATIIFSLAFVVLVKKLKLDRYLF